MASIRDYAERTSATAKITCFAIRVMSTQPARGMRDFLPEDVRRREYVIGVIRDVYDRYGFEPLETPAVENIETLLGKYGEEGNKLIFKILKRGEHEASGEADLALRYDLTVPLARVVAEHRRSCQNFSSAIRFSRCGGPTARTRALPRVLSVRHRHRRVDVSVVEAELFAAVPAILTTLGFDDFMIRLNHRRFIEAWLSRIPVPAEHARDVLVALDKVDKIGKDGVAKELAEKGYHRCSLAGLRS